MAVRRPIGCWRPSASWPEQRTVHGLYLHIPYCVAKCHYCDFNSRPPLSGERFDPYVEALCADLRRSAPVLSEVSSVFFGGGTPSLLSAAQIGRIMACVRDVLSLSADCEITLEANPGTVDGPDVEGLRAAGINRLSMGVQSTHQRLLDVLGRKHTWAEAEAAFRAARRAGFERINLDLMYGLPSQTVAEWDETLQACLALAPDHLSTYGLIVEEETTFGRLHARGSLRLPDEDEEEAMADLTRTRCQDAGLVAYETSNWARPGHECRHNLLYWDNGTYLGVGAGAVSCIDGWRYTRVRQPQLYIERSLADSSLVENAERVMPLVSLHETLSLGLRRFDGLDTARVERRYGLVPGSLLQALADAFRQEAEAGLVVLEGSRVRLTWEGMRVANHFMVRAMQLWPETAEAA